MKGVPSLVSNSTIAIVSPSWGGPNIFSGVYELGVSRLQKEFSFQIKEYPTTRSKTEYNYKPPEKRADDLAKAFQDKNVDGIICSIGGDDAVRLLPFLDQYDLPPKFFMGYSDATVLLTYLHQRGFCTFHGPSVMAGFAEPGILNDEFYNHIKTFIFEKWNTYSYRPYKKWTEETMNWSDPKRLEMVRVHQDNNGWKMIESSKTPSLIEVRGMLWGGCLEALEFIKGTKYWPGPETFWEDKIVFLEMSDEKIKHEQIKWILRNYGVQGMFTRARALLLGRFAMVTKEEKEQLENIIYNIVYSEFSSRIPIIMNMDFGHTYPQQIIPLGAQGVIKIINNEISFSIETP